MEDSGESHDPPVTAAVRAVNPARNCRVTRLKVGIYNNLISHVQPVGPAAEISDNIPLSPPECDSDNEKQKVKRKSFHQPVSEARFPFQNLSTISKIRSQTLSLSLCRVSSFHSLVSLQPTSCPTLSLAPIKFS